jgi:hypothetical protein
VQLGEAEVEARICKTIRLLWLSYVVIFSVFKPHSFYNGGARVRVPMPHGKSRERERKEEEKERDDMGSHV